MRLENAHALRHVSSRLYGLQCISGIKAIMPCRQAVQLKQGMAMQGGVRVVSLPHYYCQPLVGVDLYCCISQHYLEILTASISIKLMLSSLTEALIPSKAAWVLICLKPAKHMCACMACSKTNVGCTRQSQHSRLQKVPVWCAAGPERAGMASSWLAYPISKSGINMGSGLRRGMGKQQTSRQLRNRPLHYQQPQLSNTLTATCLCDMAISGCGTDPCMTSGHS